MGRGGPSSDRGRRAKTYPICGAKKRVSGEKCQRPAGWGTSHLGTGRCRTHAGNSPTARAAALKKHAIQFMGAPKDINPFDAIIWCIKITAGEIEFLSMEIAKLTDLKDLWVEHTIAGQQMNVMVRYRAEAQDRLVKYSKEAISLGLAERAIRMAEMFGETIARLLEGVASDLVLTPQQKRDWPSIVRKNLVVLQGGQVVSEEDRKVLPSTLVKASHG